jgi:hypothetical protein
VQETHNDAIQWGVDVDSNESSDKGWPSIPEDAVWPSPLVGDPPHSDGWPSVDRAGITVSIEVCSDVVELRGEHSTCRLLIIIGCLSVC